MDGSQNNKFNALEDLIKYCSSSVPKLLNEQPSPKIWEIYGRNIKIEDAQSRFELHQLELVDFLETENYPSFHSDENVYGPNFDPYLDNIEDDQYSSHYFPNTPMLNQNFQQPPQNLSSFDNFSRSQSPESILNKIQQKQQQKRNEEIAILLSPNRKLKQRTKPSSSSSNNKSSKTSISKIRRKFSLLAGPCKQKTILNPNKFTNSMKEWNEKIIPIIQKFVPEQL